MNEIVLYQFPISHYCEKVRWALDYKDKAYRCVNLLPGMHVKTTTRLAGRSSVPLVINGDEVIQGSAEIISYLDNTFPEKSLSPSDPDQYKQALELEKYADREVGVHIRRLCYHYLLDEQPGRIIKNFTRGGPWYGSAFLHVIFPRLKGKMRKLMKINARSAELSRKRLEKAIVKLNEHVGEKPYLFGENFTRADLAFAALLAPFSRPAQHEMDWSAPYPQELEQIVESLTPQLHWARQVYEQHRWSKLLK